MSRTCQDLFLTCNKILFIWISLIKNLGWDTYRINKFTFIVAFDSGLQKLLKI